MKQHTDYVAPVEDGVVTLFMLEKLGKGVSLRLNRKSDRQR